MRNCQKVSTVAETKISFIFRFCFSFCSYTHMRVRKYLHQHYFISFYFFFSFLVRALSTDLLLFRFCQCRTFFHQQKMRKKAPQNYNGTIPIVTPNIFPFFKLIAKKSPIDLMVNDKPFELVLRQKDQTEWKLSIGHRLRLISCFFSISVERSWYHSNFSQL